MHPAGQHRVGVLPQEAADAAQLLHGPGDLPAGRGAVRGAEGQVVPVLPGELLRLADPLPQRERGVVVPVRLGRGGQPLGLLPGPDRRGERARDVVAGQAVMGQLRRGPRHGGEPARVGQQLGEPGVQPGPLPGQQVGVEGLPDQGVPEHVPVRAARHEQLLGHAIADRVLVLRTVQPGRGPDDVVVHPAPADRRRPQHLLGRGGQLLDPGQQQGGQPAGQHVAAGCSLAPRHQRPGRLPAGHRPARRPGRRNGPAARRPAVPPRSRDCPPPGPPSGAGRTGPAARPPARSGDRPCPRSPAAPARSRPRWAAAAAPRPPGGAGAGGAGHRCGTWPPRPPAPGAGPGSGT